MSDRDARVHAVAPGADSVDLLAHLIIKAQRDSLPDLTHVTILRPGSQGDARFRRMLLRAARDAGVDAVLGPRITTLRHWVLEQTPPQAPPLSEHGRELMLFEAVRQHARLFGDHEPWSLAETLLGLFRELTLSGADTPSDYQPFVDRLREAYGLADQPDRCAQPLGREARMVHTLWHAWLTQQREEGCEDPDTAYLRALAAVEPDKLKGRALYLVGYDELLPAEVALLNGLAAAGHVCWLVPHPAPPGLPDMPPKSPPPGGNPFGEFITSAFHVQGPPLRDRARAFAAQHPQSPATDRLRLFAAEDAEAQATAIDIQIRAWLLEGHRTVGVITDDRRLARRLRALLERAGIDLDDPGGWALSTTRAAAALERWLEAVEEDFAYQPLMDVLKSSFVFPDQDREALLSAVYRLEQDVMLRENIPRGLERMRTHLEQRTARLGAAGEPGARAVRSLLDALRHAAEPLEGVAGGTALPATRLMSRVSESLARLGMSTALESDPAGRRVLEEMSAMASDANARPLTLDWHEFRTWLGRVLETRHFRPHSRPAPVRLMSVRESTLARFDALIIAAADRDRLPGHEPARALFNDSVRQALGLESWRDRLVRQQVRFRHLLEAAPRVLITWQGDGERGPQRPGSWVELIEAFHGLAWSGSLRDSRLTAWLEHEGTRVASPDTRPLPEPAQRPSPAFPTSHRSMKLSASAHQDLIDCPYRFYAARGLGLSPPEEIVEALSKADYGERIHLCLQAFHGGVTGLPGPFAHTLDEAHRSDAQDLLDSISEAVFRRDLEDNFMHRGWLARWRTLIPRYLDWAIERAAQWQVSETELMQEVELGTDLTLKGRLDRLDSGPADTAVIDYKTGEPPQQDSVEAGEAIQLPTYALLVPTAGRVEYVKLGRDKVASGAVLEGEALLELRDAVSRRLLHLVTRLRAGAPMPAWGDTQACRYCSMEVLCRRGTWEHTAVQGEN